ncbi:unnamed protein product [Linum tenue]|uniref:Patellin-4 n=1 Tax=Linum tenue TaxID=586396 RepID=A0AAV0QK92_9ROSI|nr:unnamed protein product [Linum tenue]
MTVEVIKAEAVTISTPEVVAPDEPMKAAVVEETEKAAAAVEETEKVAKSSSYREESNFVSDLKEFEKKALSDFKAKLEDAILGNTLFQTEKPKKEVKETKEKKKKEKEEAPPAAAEAEKEKETEQTVKVEGEEAPKEEAPATAEEEKKEEEAPAAEEPKTEESPAAEEPKTEEAAPAAEEVKPEGDADEKEKIIQECEAEKKEEIAADAVAVPPAEEKTEEAETEATPVVEVVDREISLWGVPLLPSKGEEGTDVVLLKFLRAREFKVNEAFEMLKKTLLWRKENNIDSILEEDLGEDLAAAFFTNGVDREGHPISYNAYGVFENQELYAKAFGDEEKRKHFLRWRIQQLEKEVQKLQLKPGCVTSLLQISDLKNSPSPSKKELRVAMKQAVGILQDNYPELVARNIFINVPFWYYAFNALLSPFLTQRTRSKIVVARPAKTTETLLKYIAVEEIPAKFGGFKRENDYEFGGESEVAEVFVKAGSSESIEIPATEVGGTLLWDATVVGGEVSYKEEFVPTDAGSYTIIIQKGKKVAAGDEPIRNTFRNNEPGKVVLTVDNCSGKKKRVLYRYKTKKTAA